jgi:hypothetical protein
MVGLTKNIDVTNSADDAKGVGSDTGVQNETFSLNLNVI